MGQGSLLAELPPGPGVGPGQFYRTASSAPGTPHPIRSWDSKEKHCFATGLKLLTAFKSQNFFFLF